MQSIRDVCGGAWMENKEIDLVSVIVPVYNVEKYLHYCLDSICNQTYRNLEIILLDDASTDHSGQLCEEYAKMDERIICIHHKVNKGLSATRNHGICKASGKYVVFIDSDDEIEYSMIEVLYETAIQYKVSIVRCGARRVNKLGGLKEDGINKKLIKYEMLEGWKYLVKYDRCSVCCGMYEIELARKMRFPVGLYYEDYYLFPRLLCQLDRVLYIDKAVLYHWYKRPGSITQTAKKSALKPDMSIVTLKNLEYFRKCYGKKSSIYSIMEEFHLRRIVCEYLATRECDSKFVKYYRKCIMRHIGTIMKNEYIGQKLKIATVYIFCFPKSAGTILDAEKIKDQQKNIMKKKVRI